MALIPGLRRGSCLLAALFVLSPLGCGSRGNSRPANVSVSGKVTYANGKPLTTGVIVFNPLEEGEEAPQAAIQPDGSFKFSDDGGMPPGEYRVSLAPSDQASTEGEEKPAPFTVSKKYLQASTSGWTATIKEGANEPFSFTMTQ